MILLFDLQFNPSGSLNLVSSNCVFVMHHERLETVKKGLMEKSDKGKVHEKEGKKKTKQVLVLCMYV